MKAWHLDAKSFGEFRKLLLAAYPSLKIQIEDGRVYARGLLTLWSVDGAKQIDRYQIELEFGPKYPRTPPIVREIGGRIPRIDDRHVTTKTGEACLFLGDEAFKYYSPAQSIVDFMRGPVENFFLSQTYFEKVGSWPTGQRPHGAHGILEFYREELGAVEPIVVANCLAYLACPNGSHRRPCYCGSGQQLRDCHFEKFEELRAKIPPATAGVSHQKMVAFIGRSDKIAQLILRCVKQTVQGGNRGAGTQTGANRVLTEPAEPASTELDQQQ
jgi:hypothetical protein